MLLPFRLHEIEDRAARRALFEDLIADNDGIDAGDLPGFLTVVRLLLDQGDEAQYRADKLEDEIAEHRDRLHRSKDELYLYADSLHTAIMQACTTADGADNCYDLFQVMKREIENL
jgi:hypothetical protein